MVARQEADNKLKSVTETHVKMKKESDAGKEFEKEIETERK